ncbi:MAG: Uma2 family endonuclease, partial [Isosphaeraceae bacterium]
MATDTSARLMTTEELLALPENGMDRELVAGELRERPMTMRNRHHSEVEASIAMVLGVCLRTRPQPRGKVVSGEAGFRLARDPDTSVGIDVAYVSAEVTSRSPDTPFFEGAPVLAVEVLSPSDRTEDIDEKVNLYLNLGVAVVWVV